MKRCTALFICPASRGEPSDHLYKESYTSIMRMQGSHQAPQQDLDLGVQTFVNGTPMSPVPINTTQAAVELPKF